MSQFQIFSNANSSTKEKYPFLLDVQSPILETLETRLVIPLTLLSNFNNRAITKLTPTIAIKGKEYLFLTFQISGIGKKNLGSFVVDISDRRQEIMSSIDFLISGY